MIHLYKRFTYPLLAISIYIALILMDFDQTMTAYWVGPYLSAAANFDWTSFNLYVNWDEIKHFGTLLQSDMFQYTFSKNNDLVLYDYLAKGLVLLIILAKGIFFWQSDLHALQSLQYLVYITISLLFLYLLKKKHEKVLFFFLYAVNPIILYFANYPYYYFWQVIPSAIFAYWYLNDKKFESFLALSIITLIFVMIYTTRPTVLFLILFFYIAYAYKQSYIKAFVGGTLFIALINLLPTLSMGPWHTMYVGIGAYDNPYHIQLDDNDGYDYYKMKTGKTVDSGNIASAEIRTPYYNVLKTRYVEIVKKNPFMIVKHALLNVFESYSIGYKVGNTFINYISAAFGLIVVGLLIYTRQYILFIAIGMSGGAFTPYYPPIGAYMYGSYLLIVIGIIGIINFFIQRREQKYAK